MNWIENTPDTDALDQTYEQFDDDPAPCILCGTTSPPILLGALGRKTWLRCRDCGIDFHEAG